MRQLRLGLIVAVNSLDTNIVLRYLLNDIPKQTVRSKAAITTSTCYVTDVVVTEVIFVLEKAIGMERTDVAALVQKFLGLPTLVYNDYFLNQVIDLYAIKQSLSFVDCYAAVETKVYGNSLITFDKELIKHGGSHVSEP